jgi:RNA polymerase sigma-70 factor (ECF subfamily)
MESSWSQSLDRLLLRARHGSQSALNHLMASHRPWLWAHVRKRLPRDLDRKADASDLVQEIQYRAAAQFSEFQGRTFVEFRAWMTGILKRQVSRAMRFWGEKRRDRRRESPGLDPTTSWQQAFDQVSTPILDRLSHEEDCERLYVAASWCRKEDLAIISEHLYEGRSHEEIAAELGIAPAAVRQRYSRAIRRAGEALRLLTLMTRRGLTALQQDVIGLHRFQGADPVQIARRLQLPEELVVRWIAEAKPLFRAIAKDGP